MKQILLLACASLLLYGCKPESKKESENPDQLPMTPIINYSVKAYHSHDTSLFTEGLLFHDGQLFESTGSPTDLPAARSMIGITDLQTGIFSKKIEIDRNRYFGEGIVFSGGKLYQLTYKNGEGFIYDANTFGPAGTFKYANVEGWGMTTDSTYIIMSDGTENLTYLDPKTLAPVKTLKVTEQGVPKEKLNELELIKGFIYANIWQEPIIVKIDPSSGNIVGKLDLSSIVYEVTNRYPNVDVLNGIAYNAATDKIYVTGKLWPTIYEIEFPH